MNRVEFDCWWADMTQRFPSVSAWLVRCFPDASAQRGLLRTWLDALADCELEDCLDVNRLMQAGHMEWPDGYAAEERLPQHVRRLARQRMRDRSPQAEVDYERPRNDTDFPAGKLLKRWIALQESGIPRE